MVRAIPVCIWSVGDLRLDVDVEAGKGDGGGVGGHLVRPSAMGIAVRALIGTGRNQPGDQVADHHHAGK